MAIKRTADDYKSLAERMGFEWLGPEVSNTSEKTTWKCKRTDHPPFPKSFKEIQRGVGCKPCGIEDGAAKRRFSDGDYHALANQRGWRWVAAALPAHSHDETGWKCPEGHEVKATYTAVRLGKQCRQCRRSAIARGDIVIPNQRYGPEKYRQLAESRGITWCGPEVKRASDKTYWKCPVNDHPAWPAPYNSIQQGRGCRLCSSAAFSRRTRYGPEMYRELARDKGVVWDGPEVPNTWSKTFWICAEGHRMDMTYNAVQSGRGCRFCGGSAPKASEDYESLAAHKGIEWVGPMPPNTKDDTGWICPTHGRFSASYQDVRAAQLNGCSVCGQIAAAEAQRFTNKQYEALARERGIEFVGPVPLGGALAPTMWRCPIKEHPDWPATYGNIYMGRGCPVCGRDKTAESLRYGPDKYLEMAAHRGFRWLGPEVDKTGVNTIWCCDKDHEFPASYNNLQQGRGCPTCVDVVNGASVSAVQRQLCELLDGELNKRVGTLAIDVALDIGGVPIAVEYDSWYWHGNRLEHDRKRDTRLIEQGWRILRIRSNSLLPEKEQIDKAIRELLDGTWVSEIVMPDWGRGHTRLELIG